MYGDQSYNFFGTRNDENQIFGAGAVDRIFGNINACVNGVKTVFDTITDDGSRRNNQYYGNPYPQYQYQYGYPQQGPGFVGYGWGNIPASAFLSNNQTYGGYPGIWNPDYGMGGYRR